MKCSIRDLLLVTVIVPCPAEWLAQVAAPQSEVELAALRRSVLRGKPYDSSDWVHQTRKDWA